MYTYKCIDCGAATTNPDTVCNKCWDSVMRDDIVYCDDCDRPVNECVCDHYEEQAEQPYDMPVALCATCGGDHLTQHCHYNMPNDADDVDESAQYSEGWFEKDQKEKANTVDQAEIMSIMHIINTSLYRM